MTSTAMAPLVLRRRARHGGRRQVRPRDPRRRVRNGARRRPFTTLRAAASQPLSGSGGTCIPSGPPRPPQARGQGRCACGDRTHGKASGVWAKHLGFEARLRPQVVPKLGGRRPQPCWGVNEDCIGTCLRAERLADCAWQVGQLKRTHSATRWTRWPTGGRHWLRVTLFLAHLASFVALFLKTRPPPKCSGAFGLISVASRYAGCPDSRRSMASGEKWGSLHTATWRSVLRGALAVERPGRSGL